MAEHVQVSAVGQHDALGKSGGTAGVDHDGHFVPVGGNFRIIGAAGCQKCFIFRAVVGTGPAITDKGLNAR